VIAIFWKNKIQTRRRGTLEAEHFEMTNFAERTREGGWGYDG